MTIFHFFRNFQNSPVKTSTFSKLAFVVPFSMAYDLYKLVLNLNYFCLYEE